MFGRTPLSLTREIVKPHHLFTSKIGAKDIFLTYFRTTDTNSFFFLQYLIKYCEQNNNSEWVDIIDQSVLESISSDTGYDFHVEDLDIFKKGYIIKSDAGYELTHEFVVLSYLSCSDGGDTLAIFTSHIDFSNEERIIHALQDLYQIHDNSLQKFLYRILVDLSKTPGMLNVVRLDLARLYKISLEASVGLSKYMDLAQKHDLLHMEHFIVPYNGFEKLIWAAYLASPALPEK